MPLDMTYGELRALLSAEKLGWQTHPEMPDYVRLPHYSLGASSEGLLPTAQVQALDTKKMGVGANPYVAIGAPSEVSSRLTRCGKSFRRNC